LNYLFILRLDPDPSLKVAVGALVVVVVVAVVNAEKVEAGEEVEVIVEIVRIENLLKKISCWKLKPPEIEIGFVDEIRIR